MVVCADLWGKELHRQVGVGMMVTSGSLRGAMVAHWLGMPEMLVGTIFRIFITPTTPVSALACWRGNVLGPAHQA